MSHKPTQQDHTHITRFRIPRPMWNAFGHVSSRLGTNRTARLLAYIRADIQENGTDEDRAALAAAEAELVERRARTGGRPRALSEPE